MDTTPLEKVLAHLRHLNSNGAQKVVMTCGIAGAGKSTLAKGVINTLPNFVRLSVDSYIYENHGLFKIDYPKEKHSEYLDEGQLYIKSELARLLDEKQKDVVLDLSFWNKEYREEYKKIINEHGGRWVLVFLDAAEEVLQRRIAKRRQERDAVGLDDPRRDGDSAFDIDIDTFQMYLDGFERPVGEGEFVVNVI